MKDWRGTPIEVGSTIVYPGRQGSSVWVNEAVVLEVGERRRWQLLPGETEPALKVRRTHDTTGWRDLDKVSTVTAVDRVTVVGPRG